MAAAIIRNDEGVMITTATSLPTIIPLSTLTRLTNVLGETYEGLPPSVAYIPTGIATPIPLGPTKPSSIELDSHSPTPTSTLAPTTAIVTVSAVPAATSDQAAGSSDGGLSLPLKITAIVVPILAVLALIPIAYLFYLRRRHRRNSQNIPELRVPMEQDPLKSHSRNNSHSSTSFPLPFFDRERARSSSFGVADRPTSVESSRPPSPTLPSPSQPMFRNQEAWPLTSVLPDPPAAYDPHVTKPRADSGTLRPDSNTLGVESIIHRPMSASRPSSSTYTGTPVGPAFPAPNLAVNDSRDRFSKRTSDAVSEMSVDPGTGRRRSDRSADEMSLVSALSPEEHEDRHFSRMI